MKKYVGLLMTCCISSAFAATENEKLEKMYGRSPPGVQSTPHSMGSHLDNVSVPIPLKGSTVSNLKDPSVEELVDNLKCGVKAAFEHLIRYAQEGDVAAAKALEGLDKISAVPSIARGYEALYQIFMAGSLIYRPNGGSPAGQIDMPIASIANPETLEGTFNLSECGDASKYISIHSGFRKGTIAENNSKLEVWIVPKFVVEKNKGSAWHLSPALKNWSAPYGIFFTWGGWDNLERYDYETTISPERLSTENLFKIAQGARALTGGHSRSRPFSTHFCSMSTERKLEELLTDIYLHFPPNGLNSPSLATLN